MSTIITPKLWLTNYGTLYKGKDLILNKFSSIKKKKLPLPFTPIYYIQNVKEDIIKINENEIKLLGSSKLLDPLQDDDWDDDFLDIYYNINYNNLNWNLSNKTFMSGFTIINKKIVHSCDIDTRRNAFNIYSDNDLNIYAKDDKLVLEYNKNSIAAAYQTILTIIESTNNSNEIKEFTFLNENNVEINDRIDIFKIMQNKEKIIIMFSYDKIQDICTMINNPLSKNP